MTTIKFLYLDDEPKTEVEAYIRKVKAHNSNLEIELRAPRQFTEQMDLIQDRLSQQTIEEGFFHGLILDYRLSEKSDWSLGDEGVKAGYNAPTLAQEIRNRATDLVLPSFPIMLWSTHRKFSSSYWKDDTSHDLFDARAVKDRLIDEPVYAKEIAEKLVSLVNGYGDILEKQTTDAERSVHLLNIGAHPGVLDPRMRSQLAKGPIDKPVHEQARFIISQLLEIPNSALIDGKTLAARLGIDIADNKSPDYAKLVDSHFQAATYIGPFSSGWPCWWQPLIENIWDELPNSPGPLRELTAEQRVQFMKRHLGVDNIVAIQPIEFAEYESFWTVCQATLKPIDLRDGFITDRPRAHPWQDLFYVSFFALIEGIADEMGVELDPIEESRYRKIKKRIIRR